MTDSKREVAEQRGDRDEPVAQAFVYEDVDGDKCLGLRLIKKDYPMQHGEKLYTRPSEQLAALRAQLAEREAQLAESVPRNLFLQMQAARHELADDLAASEARVREARADLLALHSFNVGFGPAAVWWSDVQKVIAALSGQKQEG